MKLTAILLRFKKRPPRGNIWSGKYRLWRAITPEMTQAQVEKYQLEERNLFYLRHPYLTFEQAEGHEEVLHPDKERQEYFEAKAKEWKQHQYLGDSLGFLKVDEKWE